MTDASIRDAVLAAVVAMAQQRGATITEVQENQALSADLGFESLDLAQVAAELEIRLRLDPFARASASRIVTVGDLVAFYENSAAAIK